MRKLRPRKVLRIIQPMTVELVGLELCLLTHSVPFLPFYLSNPSCQDCLGVKSLPWSALLWLWLWLWAAGTIMM